MRNDIPPLTSFQQTALVVLRTLVGWHFLYEAVYKLRLPGWTPDGEPIAAWTSAGFLKAATGPLAPLARSVASAGLTPIIDRVVALGLLAIGLSLMLGILSRVGCTAALAFLSLVYLTTLPTTGLPQAGREGTYLLVDKTLIEAAAVVVLLAFGTGRIAGLDRLWQARRPARGPAANGATHRIQEGSRP